MEQKTPVVYPLKNTNTFEETNFEKIVHSIESQKENNDKDSLIYKKRLLPAIQPPAKASLNHYCN